ncbi:MULTISPECIES: CPBP family glutamic-type intramembrane protease [Fusobacterium]|uniref:CPBP family glutamic-type intramembrane protease n=1 Tax=Fusobacterium TaxID=848 RepID=UPI0003B8CC2B|nr:MULTISPECIES: CPBP family glutamic-type intramembrane protease [Fusobacterium]ERT35666.1 hypothetical protein HMPREF1766_01201 [Fusobacterium nucleatum CTI-5]
MINKFQSYVDNIQENDKKKLLILPLIILVVMQIIGFFLGMASVFIVSFISIIKHKTIDFEVFLSGTSSINLITYTLILFFTILLIKQNTRSKLSEIGINGENGIKYFCYGSLVGIVMATIVFLLLFFSNSILVEMNENIIYVDIFKVFIVFFVLALGDQILMRNYFLTFFTKIMGIRNSTILISFISVLIFLIAKGFKILDIKTLIFLLNTFLAYILNSLIYYFYGNMWLVVGISTLNNFFETMVFGSKLDILYAINPLFKLRIIENTTILNGGNYGFEGGIFYTILYLAGVLFMLYKINSEKDIKLS